MFYIHTKYCNVFYPKQGQFPGEPAYNPKTGYLWFPYYNPIHRTSSAFISCPSFVQISFSILMQFSFSGTITGAFPRVKNLHGFKVYKMSVI